MKKFEVGKTYVTWCLRDSTVQITMTVIARTENALTISLNNFGNGRKQKKRVFRDLEDLSECVTAPRGYFVFNATRESAKFGSSEREFNEDWEGTFSGGGFLGYNKMGT